MVLRDGLEGTAWQELWPEWWFVHEREEPPESSSGSTPSGRLSEGDSLSDSACPKWHYVLTIWRLCWKVMDVCWKLTVICWSPPQAENWCENILIQTSGIGEECQHFWAWILGMIYFFFFGGGVGGWSRGETRPKNLWEKIGEEFAEKIVGNSPKFDFARPKQKSQLKSALQSSEIKFAALQFAQTPEALEIWRISV